MLPPMCNRCGSDICEHTSDHMDKLEDRLKDLESKLSAVLADNVRLAGALERIANGGVPFGVQANVIERHLAMVDIAREVLGRVKK